MSKPLKLLIGGSPCTHWSIAQQKNREVTASGEGWELFKNYLIAKEKFQPNYFLYENNKSAATAIKDQISKELNVELQYIDSALVSAQHRQRFYAHNIPNVPAPEDRNIYLVDILDVEGVKCASSERINAGRAQIQKDNSIIYIVNQTKDNKAGCIRASCYKDGMRNLIGNSVDKKTCVAETSNLQVDNEKILQVTNKKINYKGNLFNIELPDGAYKIRKFTPIECERLQTLPDNYTEGISNTQRYKCIGNGWTAEVIIHILSYIDYPKDAPIEILSMYDGIATGMYCLNKLGYTNIIYKAYEIDKYAIQIAKKNYPNIIECGDAFQVRNKDWRY